MIRRPPKSTLFPSTPLFRPRPATPPGRAPGTRRLPPRLALQDDERTAPAATSRPEDERWLRETPDVDRSEEHTSELQSPCNLVCRLLLEKIINTRIRQRHIS